MKSDRNRPLDILEAGNDGAVIMTHYKQMVGRHGTVGDLIADLSVYCDQNKIEWAKEMAYAMDRIKEIHGDLVIPPKLPAPKRGEIA